MAGEDSLEPLRAELERELTGDILPWWATRMPDHEHGGFLGRVDGEGRSVPDAPKGGILNARILWTFSAAFRALGDPAHRELADRAREYVLRRFWDAERGGTYWMLDHRGAPLDTRKHVYAQAFSLYALAEHHAATGAASSRERAVELFGLIERHCADAEHGGYVEACDRSWRRLEDARLSDKDDDVAKSQNTHLHLLEAYTTLCRVWPDAAPRDRLRDLVELFLERIYDPDTRHLGLFFDDDWTPRSDAVSYGHDIEASWLLLDAADAIGDAGLRERTRDVSLALARATLEEGCDPNGGIANLGGPAGVTDASRDWWTQAEAIVGFVNAWQETGEAAFAEAASRTWAFTQRRIVDAEHGEWRWGVTADGRPRSGEDLAGPWKCPYHNARACLEVTRRLRAAGSPGEAGAQSERSPAGS